jgi:ubiquinone/menaquinone biosynthesis C-methylase UbiE
MKLNWIERLVVNNPIRVGAQREQIKWFRRRLVPPPAATILEIGCGRGAGARLIAEAFRPAALHISDLDERMIRSARRYENDASRRQVSFHVADATALPVKTGSADALFGFGFLHHVPDWPAALSEVARVLRRGGVYYMEELYPSLYQNRITRHLLVHPRGGRFDSRDLKSALTERGFEAIHTAENKWVGILGVYVMHRRPV